MLVAKRWVPTIVINGVKWGLYEGPKINGGYNYNPTSWGGFNSIDNWFRAIFVVFAVILERWGKASEILKHTST